jgi:type I restriction enzyme S subunit
MESGHTPSREHSEWWDGDVPWIGIADAREHDGGIILETIQHTNADGLANSAARLLPAGTVCISRTASVGYVVVMGRPMSTSQDFVNWTPTSAVTSDWLRLVFTADRESLRRFGKGSVHKTIYFPEWLSVHIAVPPLAEQSRIVAESDRLLSVAAGASASLAIDRRRCSRLRQSVLKWAFEGKLVDQDPNDEPAEQLLARIRADRAAAVPSKNTRSRKSNGAT